MRYKAVGIVGVLVVLGTACPDPSDDEPDVSLPDARLDTSGGEDVAGDGGVDVGDAVDGETGVDDTSITDTADTSEPCATKADCPAILICVEGECQYPAGDSGPSDDTGRTSDTGGSDGGDAPDA